MDADNPFRKLPQVQRLLETAQAQHLCAVFGRTAAVGAIRAALARARASLSAGQAAQASADAILESAAADLARTERQRLRRTINATGIVLHTNLGRSPLAAEAVEAVSRAASGYCNLEFDLATGRRGLRGAALEDLLAQTTGAEAALAVNNGAAAILLTLCALAAGGEVIVSRGELVEIGGGFRIPDVIRQGGARLVEVGSTNRTRPADYRSAITPETRVLLKVHQSNFRTIGFTEETGIAQLAALGREHGLLTVVDLGSGLLNPIAGISEPAMADALGLGADVVTCSGDKLLGGPQAGLVLGRRVCLDRLRGHPLLRALRLDKMSLAALEETLRLHRDRPQAIPVIAMMSQDVSQLRQRALRLRGLVGDGEVVTSQAYAGGGALPEEQRESIALKFIPKAGCEEMSRRLRLGEMPVAGRIAKDSLLLDMLTVSDDELEALAGAVRLALA